MKKLIVIMAVICGLCGAVYAATSIYGDTVNTTDATILGTVNTQITNTVTVTGTVAVSGTTNAQITNTVPVTIGGTVNAQITNTVPVTVSGTVNAQITNTVPVTVTGTVTAVTSSPMLMEKYPFYDQIAGGTSTHTTFSDLANISNAGDEQYLLINGTSSGVGATLFWLSATAQLPSTLEFYALSESAPCTGLVTTAGTKLTAGLRTSTGSAPFTQIWNSPTLSSLGTRKYKTGFGNGIAVEKEEFGNSGYQFCYLIHLVSNVSGNIASYIIDLLEQVSP